MLKLLKQILGYKCLVVAENQRVLTIQNGQLSDILLPGEHFIRSAGRKLDIEWFNLSIAWFVSDYSKALFEKLPYLADKHLLTVKTGADEVAILEQDGRVARVVGPDTTLHVWKDAGPWKVETINVAENPVIPAKLWNRLAIAGATERIERFVVDEGKTGLRYEDAVMTGQFKPGVYTFWRTAIQTAVKMIDLRWQTLEVSGQEVLTRDKVTVRINITAEYRVVDAVKAVNSVSDFNDQIYRTLQIAYRKLVGSTTLDQLLERKAVLDEEAMTTLAKQAGEIGLEVTQVTLKDIILPGEMREILNKVVAAEKEAEANVIRRREETNATRSLLNTAKVMAENPVMLRLKELEALETIAGKVETLTVHNGTSGLLNDLVDLRQTQ